MGIFSGKAVAKAQEALQENLGLAIIRHDVKAVKAALESGASPDRPAISDAKAPLPLSTAIIKYSEFYGDEGKASEAKDSFEIIETLVEAKANPIQDLNGLIRPVDCAARLGLFNVVALFNRGTPALPSQDALDQGLQRAINNQDPDAIKFALAAGANPDKPGALLDGSLTLPLNKAIKKHHQLQGDAESLKRSFRVIEALVEAGVNPQQEIKGHISPTDCAARLGLLDIVELFERAGRARRKMPPTHIAPVIMS